MPDDTVPAWAIALGDDRKVTLIRDKEKKRNMLIFERGGHETKLILSDEALSAVVTLAVSRAGVAVAVDGAADA